MSSVSLWAPKSRNRVPLPTYPLRLPHAVPYSFRHGRYKTNASHFEQGQWVVHSLILRTEMCISVVSHIFLVLGAILNGCKYGICLRNARSGSSLGGRRLPMQRLGRVFSSCNLFERAQKAASMRLPRLTATVFSSHCGHNIVATRERSQTLLYLFGNARQCAPLAQEVRGPIAPVR